MWVLIITLLLFATSAEVTETSDEKISVEVEESDEGDSEEAGHYDDDQQEFENRDDSSMDDSIKPEKQFESHPPAFGPRSTNVLKRSQSK
ncbi:unnamed protein product [Litomosoides sigmodontis]|uniref:Uncharacterized protein n=1 Tax=Litomosoides sigmodontis TaxID=42156 RepID=A0A3P6S8Q7_LITSI|nr:unnamed protein product [Litomosoides sigmodontis]